MDGARVHTFRFELSVIFDIEVAALTILAGRLTGLRAGSCTLTCALLLQLPRGYEEIIREQKKIDPHVVVSFGQGISLLPADDRAAAAAGTQRPVQAS